MDFTNLLTIVVGNAAFIIPLFLWNRSESRADVRNMDIKIDLNRSETNSLIMAIQCEMKEFHTKLALQDLEFKTRLCSIEERNKK